MAVKKFDLVIYGASSFVGQILTEYLYEHIGLTRKVKWAIAGRSETKLNELRDSLGEGAAKLPIIIADSHDESGLRDMCERSRVIISTVKWHDFDFLILSRSTSTNTRKTQQILLDIICL